MRSAPTSVTVCVGGAGTVSVTGVDGVSNVDDGAGIGAAGGSSGSVGAPLAGEPLAKPTEPALFTPGVEPASDSAPPSAPSGRGPTKPNPLFSRSMAVVVPTSG